MLQPQEFHILRHFIGGTGVPQLAIKLFAGWSIRCTGRWLSLAADVAGARAVRCISAWLGHVSRQLDARVDENYVFVENLNIFKCGGE